jgi:hypothetical protein
MSQLRNRHSLRVIAGQQVGLGADPSRMFDAQVARLRELSGKSPALIGMDYGYARDAAAQPQPRTRSDQNNLLIDHWKAGGLVMLSFQARNPWTGESSWDTRVGALEELVTPGKPAHAAWLKELDAVAGALTELRDAGVVVLWRPFHDMNADWFWWGRLQTETFSREGFVKLWTHMFDYFTRTKKLNNLLWVYSAASAAHRTTSVTAYFPGSGHCDLVGLNSYSSEAILDGYHDMVQLEKPFGITEFGAAPDDPGSMDYERLRAAIHAWYPLTAFFLAAAERNALIDSLNGARLMQDSWVIARDDLGWRPGHRRWKQSDKLALESVEVLTKTPVCWERVDIRIDLAASFDTPFDTAEIEVDARITLPSGKTLTLPAFFDQPFERQIWGSGRYSEEAMAEAGKPEWRVRFMPTEAGEYRFVVRARDRSGATELKPASFSVQAAPGTGFIRVSAKDPHYFEFDNGTPFFAIGMNIVEHPLSEYYRYLPRLAENGGNFSRLWIGYDYFALELGAMGDYRLDNAWRLDQVLELSERHGIYQKLCIDWIRHITLPGEPRKTFDHELYAYSVSNGGPCRNMRDFFTLPEARRRFKNRLRYIVARWGYSPNVMAWELWNEIDMVDPKAAERSVIVTWNQEMCRYLKSIDPWQHLTTNSLAGRRLGTELWSLEENQFAQRHGYATPSPRAIQAHADLAGLVIQWLDDVSQFNKPYLMAEFGLQRDRMEVRAISDRDRNGVHMHNGIWAALAHGSAGTAQLWWWGQYVDPKNLYYHFRSVADFTRNIPWTTAGFARAEIQSSDPNLRVLGLRGKTASILWLQNMSHTWWNVVSEAVIPPVEPGGVTLAGFQPGRYRVEYWNTYEGRIESISNVTATGESLQLPTPRIDKDIAVKIFPETLDSVR